MVRTAIWLVIGALAVYGQPKNPVFATYFGGSGYEIPGALAVGRDGSVYIAGRTDSKDFPVKNALQAESHAFSQIFLAKFTPAGELVYSTYLGGSDNDAAAGIAVDEAGNVYLTGNLHSRDFPMVKAFQASPGGQVDAFVMKLDASGRVLYATYLGGRFNDLGMSIAADEQGNAYVTGFTESPDFPVTAGAMQTTPPGYKPGYSFRDAFVTKLDYTGKLVWSTYLGGTGANVGWSVAVDADGQAQVAGETSSFDFPVGGNALQWSPGRASPYGQGSNDGFLTKLKADGSGFVYSTYIGGPADDSARSVTVDGAGRAYVTGLTTNARMPILGGPQPYLGGDVLYVKDAGSEAFVPRRNGLAAAQVTALAFDPNLPSLEYAGTLQGVFRSTDGGETWAPAGLDQFGILQLVPDPAHAGAIYAAASFGSGVFRSTDAGDTWVSLTSGFPGNLASVQFPSLAVAGDGSGTLYVTASNGGISAGAIAQPVFRVTDSGATWTLIGDGLPSSANALAVGPGGTVYAANAAFQFFSMFGTGPRVPGTVFRRESNRWVAADLDDNIQALAFHGDTLLAAGRKFYKSADGGRTWTASALPDGGNVVQMSVDPRDPTLIYLARDNNRVQVLLRSTDGGATWAPMGSPGASALTVNPADGSVQVGAIASADAYLAVFDPDGAAVFTSFAGGPEAEMGDAIVRDPAGRIWVAGFESEGNLAVAYDGRTFVRRVDVRGEAVHLGGSTSAGVLGMPCRALAVAPDGALVALMSTAADGLPVQSAVQEGMRGSADLYLVKWYPE